MYDIDTNKIDKGYRIPVSEVERLVDAKRHLSAFSLGAVKLCSYITTRLAERGINAVACVQGGAIVVLTDDDATAYLHKQSEGLLRRMVTNHARMLLVDRGQITSDDKRDEHDRRLSLQGGMLSAVRKVRRSFQLKTAGRTTPLIKKS
jgi:hypothetical protein